MTGRSIIKISIKANSLQGKTVEFVQHFYPSEFPYLTGHFKFSVQFIKKNQINLSIDQFVQEFKVKKILKVITDVLSSTAFVTLHVRYKKASQEYCHKYLWYHLFSFFQSLLNNLYVLRYLLIMFLQQIVYGDLINFDFYTTKIKIYLQRSNKIKNNC